VVSTNAMMKKAFIVHAKYFIFSDIVFGVEASKNGMTNEAAVGQRNITY
jgi:hypothetical protein